MLKALLAAIKAFFNALARPGRGARREADGDDGSEVLWADTRPYGWREEWDDD